MMHALGFVSRRMISPGCLRHEDIVERLPDGENCCYLHGVVEW